MTHEEILRLIPANMNQKELTECAHCFMVLHLETIRRAAELVRAQSSWQPSPCRRRRQRRFPPGDQSN